MINFSYRFTSTDVTTFLCTLAVLPFISFPDLSSIQKEINDSCCKSAINKFLTSRSDFIPNEIRVMAISLDVADAILKGELDIDEDIKNELSKFRFSINKLLPIFGAVFE